MTFLSLRPHPIFLALLTESTESTESESESDHDFFGFRSGWGRKQPQKNGWKLHGGGGYRF